MQPIMSHPQTNRTGAHVEDRTGPGLAGTSRLREFPRVPAPARWDSGRRTWGLIPVTSSWANDSRVFRVAQLIQVAAPTHGVPGNGLIAKEFEELGYIEGRNIVFDRRFAAGDGSRFPAFAAEVVALKPDLIIVETTLSAPWQQRGRPQLFRSSSTTLRIPRARES
jgi:hypothetical protein